MKHPLLSLKTLVAASATALLITGCAETLDTHGQVILPSAMAKIQPNVSTKDDVRQLLGTPSSVGTMNDNRWYYVSSMVAQQAFKPNVLKSRRVVIMDFDPSTSVVLNVAERTERDGKALEPAAAATNTQGQTMGFFDQMFGNFGIK